MHPFPSAMMQSGGGIGPPFKLYTWGGNNHGQLGLGNTTYYSSPKQVGSLLWNSVGCGGNHTVAVRSDGTLWTWGRNNFGQLGLGDTTNRSSPVQVGAGTAWSSVFGDGYSSFAIRNDGTLWAWGRAYGGCLGDGTTVNKSSPVQIGALTNWLGGIGVGLGTGVLFRKADGTLWSWGVNAQGQLGQNDTTNRSSPTQIGTLSDWSAIGGGGGDFGAAIRANGTLWTWGINSVGQLGLGDTTSRSSPTQVGALTTWSALSSSGYAAGHIWAANVAGNLFAWGRNTIGQLGDGTTVNKSSPVQIGALTDWNPNSPVLSVTGWGATQRYSAAAIKSDRSLWASGRGGGVGFPPSDTSSPVQIGSIRTWAAVVAGIIHGAALAK